MRQSVFVFKTNLQNALELEKMKVLDNMKGIIHWNADLEDCDKVLRVVASGIPATKIIQMLASLNLHCEELT